MLKKVGTFAMVCAAGFVFLFVFPLLFIKGAVWASEHLLEPMITVGWWVLGVTVVVLLPLALIKRMRAFVAIAILYSSFVYGVIAWLTGFVITYNIWGVFGVAMGLLFAGVGVVPVGLLASALHGWEDFVPLLVLVSLTFGSRIFAFKLASSADEFHAARALVSPAA